MTASLLDGADAVIVADVTSPTQHHASALVATQRIRSSRRERMRARADRTRETLSALIASPDTPILDLIGGWRGVADAVGPNLLFLAVYLVTPDLVASALCALGASIALVVVRSAARQPVGPAVGGMALLAMSGVMALMGGDGGDVFLPDLVQTGVVSAFLLLSIAIRRPLVGVILGPLVSGRDWRTTRALLRGYDWATALMAAAAATRTLSKLPFYFADDVVALSISDLVTGVPLAIVVTYLQIRILRRAYAAAGATVGAPDRLQHQRTALIDAEEVSPVTPGPVRRAEQLIGVSIPASAASKNPGGSRRDSSLYDLAPVSAHRYAGADQDTR